MRLDATRVPRHRPPAVAAQAMAATSHPLATHAALRAFEDGGNACDAAVTAAAVLSVCEPMSTGIGGDAFALVYADGALTGLNASGAAPLSADPDALETIPRSGRRAVTVPGAVGGWAALLERFGRLGLDRCLAPAIDAAERGYALTPTIARQWAMNAERLAVDAEAARVYLPVPSAGDLVRLPHLAETLRELADHGPDAFYRGDTALAICAVSWLEEEDLARYAPEWVDPIRLPYQGLTVCELPPNTQGAAALQALGIAAAFDLDSTVPAHERVHVQVEAMKLAFADAYRYIADDPLPLGYLEPDYLNHRAGKIDRRRAGNPRAGRLPRGGTVYLCTVDEERMACSFIQSLYDGFGAGVVASGTGVLLQNRAACFTLEPAHRNRLAPGRRPFHTVIPGMLLAGGDLLGPFGLMGGHMQAQGHLQLVSALVDRGLDPQAALDEPRFRLDPDPNGWTLAIEPEFAPLAGDLESLGHRTVVDSEPVAFGGGQVIVRLGDALIGGSEPRRDGYAAGL